MFNRMLSAFGIGGPSVDTVLDSPHAVPGEPITGQVRIQGGSTDAGIDQVALSLITHVETEHGDHEHDGGVREFFRLVAQQNVRVPAGQLVSIPFQLPLPWGTPITAVGGAALPGISVGVRTELKPDGATDVDRVRASLASGGCATAFFKTDAEFQRTRARVRRSDRATQLSSTSTGRRA